MTIKDLDRKWKSAEAAAERWDRTLITAIHKVRLYRKRAKYYRAKLDGVRRLSDVPVGRARRRIRGEELQ